jgi:shikimate kinase
VAALPHTIVLVGLMGTGKTTVGGLLAGALGVPLLDSDEMIVARTGQTVREIFEHEGEPAFRVQETAALLDALADPEPAVIAAAGGVVLSEVNRAALVGSGAVVVWLRADPDLLLGRVFNQGHRPLLDDDPAGTLAAMQATREPLYREVADLVIDVAGRTPSEVAAQVLQGAAAWVS